jgi:hypothetical protein
MDKNALPQKGTKGAKQMPTFLPQMNTDKHRL